MSFQEHEGSEPLRRRLQVDGDSAKTIAETELVLDNRHNPFLPSAVLATIFRSPATNTTPGYVLDTLSKLNRKPNKDIVADARVANMISDDQKVRLDGLLQNYNSSEGRLFEHSKARATNYGYDPASEGILLRNFSAMRLLLKAIQIVTPPRLTFIREQTSEKDLISEAHDGLSTFAVGLWAKFVGINDLCFAWGVRKLLYAVSNEHLSKNVEALDEGLQDTAGHGSERLGRAFESQMQDRKTLLRDEYEAGRESLKRGLDAQFRCVHSLLATLHLHPLCMLFFQKRLEQCIWAFARIDKDISDDDKRYAENLIFHIRQIAGAYIERFATPTGQAGMQDHLDSLLSELDQLIGLASVKQRVKELANFVRIQEIRVRRGAPKVNRSLHAVFAGNPGTGKTSVARVMGRIYKSLGVLAKGHVVECDRSRLVADYVGQTASKTNSVISSALDGILFIDEAYTLISKVPGDYGTEAVETILKRMEDERDRLIVIVAGYTDEMELFISSNPGLKSRFTNYIYFPDYSPEDLRAIFVSMAKQNGFECSELLLKKILLHHQAELDHRGPHFGNAREVRNSFEATLSRQANRLAQQQSIDDRSLSLLEADDFAVAN